MKTKPAPPQHPEQAPLPEQGAWPILEPAIEDDETAAATAAAGLDEGVTEAPRDRCDDLTPSTLLGNHRDGKWASREDEGDRGVG